MAQVNNYKSKIKKQFVADGDMYFGTVNNYNQLAQQLELLEQEIGKASSAETIDKLTASRASTPLLEAAEEARKPEPDKSAILSKLDTVKECLDGAVKAGGLLEAVKKAYDFVQGFI